jgi:hypothetical protein
VGERDRGLRHEGLVIGSDAVHFTFGASAAEFEFDAEALRHFLTMATQALQEMDHRHTLEQAGAHVPDEATELMLTVQTQR